MLIYLFMYLLFVHRLPNIIYNIRAIYYIVLLLYYIIVYHIILAGPARPPWGRSGRHLRKGRGTAGNTIDNPV